MNTSNSNDNREVNIWYKKQLELRRDYLELLIKRGYSQEQAGFDIRKQLESIHEDIMDLEEKLNFN